MGTIWRVGRKATDWWKRTSLPIRPPRPRPATFVAARFAPPPITKPISTRPGRQGGPPDGSRRCEGDRQVLGAVDEVGLQALHRSVLADVGYAIQQAVEHHHDLHAGQVRPQAEVRAITSAGEGVVGRARDGEG